MEKQTCLYDRHVALGALMSPFGGFIMPIQYTRMLIILKEYLDIVNNEYKEISKEFFEKKKVWLKIYREEKCSYYDTNHIECVDLLETIKKRQSVGTKRSKIKNLIKCLEGGVK